MANPFLDTTYARGASAAHVDYGNIKLAATPLKMPKGKVPGAQGVLDRVLELLGGGKEMQYTRNIGYAKHRNAPVGVSLGHLPPTHTVGGEVNPAYAEAVKAMRAGLDPKQRKTFAVGTKSFLKSPGFEGLGANDPAVQAEAQKVLAARLAAGGLGAAGLYGGYRLLGGGKDEPRY